MRIRDLIRSILFASLPSAVGAGDLALKPGLYDIAAQTVMPHLEEMRRNTVHHSRCLHNDKLTSIFPVTDQRALMGCDLRYANQVGDVFYYSLNCQDARVATGTAELQMTRERIVGTLEVKMGGKNMTFSQFVKATWKEDCQRRSGKR